MIDKKKQSCFKSCSEDINNEGHFERLGGVRKTGGFITSWILHTRLFSLYLLFIFAFSLILLGFHFHFNMILMFKLSLLYDSKQAASGLSLSVM